MVQPLNANTGALRAVQAAHNAIIGQLRVELDLTRRLNSQQRRSDARSPALSPATEIATPIRTGSLPITGRGAFIPQVIEDSRGRGAFTAQLDGREMPLSGFMMGDSRAQAGRASASRNPSLAMLTAKSNEFARERALSAGRRSAIMTLAARDAQKVSRRSELTASRLQAGQEFASRIALQSMFIGNILELSQDGGAGLTTTDVLTRASGLPFLIQSMDPTNAIRGAGRLTQGAMLKSVRIGGIGNSQPLAKMAIKNAKRNGRFTKGAAALSSAGIGLLSGPVAVGAAIGLVGVAESRERIEDVKTSQNAILNITRMANRAGLTASQFSDADASIENMVYSQLNTADRWINELDEADNFISYGVKGTLRGLAYTFGIASRPGEIEKKRETLWKTNISHRDKMIARTTQLARNGAFNEVIEEEQATLAKMVRSGGTNLFMQTLGAIGTASDRYKRWRKASDEHARFEALQSPRGADRTQD